MFDLNSSYEPAGDQAKAIDYLVNGVKEQRSHQVLLGVTGSGKTFTMANVIKNLNRPALIIAHNKTLAAQLFSEFKSFFPNNAVEFFISYYDYYQPEAYIPSRDAYIEKEAEVNEEIEKLRHSATRSLLLRKDVIIIASVSCIYGLGLPEDYMKGVLHLKCGQMYKRRDVLSRLESAQYERNDIEFRSGSYRIKGDVLDIYASWDDCVYRVEFFGDECESLSILEPITFKTLSYEQEVHIFPATHYVVDDYQERAISDIRTELNSQVALFNSQGKDIEAHRIRQRTQYDLEMIEEMGYCKGIENYSRHLSGRAAGEPSGVLMDFFPDDFVTFIDESHVTIPQIRGMYNGDQARKQALVDHGFRLPSAKDNRPLNFSEFESKNISCIYVSATPGDYECEMSLKEGMSYVKGDWDNIYCAQQIVRPTGLLDPHVEVRPTKAQIDNIKHEIQLRIDRNERVLLTALTKQMSEDLHAFFQKEGFKSQYLHSEIVALDRLNILRNLRSGEIDVLIGVNLLREGLDLPEVSLVIILDADKEGFLRTERSLIQTIGRAARHKDGKVILYADKISPAMKHAIDETNRRRDIQKEYNDKFNIEPRTIQKPLDSKDTGLASLKRAKLKSPKDEIALVDELRQKMKEAADNLNFELAAYYRDQINAL